MKTMAIAVLAVSTLLSASAQAKDKPMGDVVWPAESVKWEAGPVAGTKIAKLWGDWMKGGPYGVLVKFESGQVNALHHHTRALKIVVISGTFVHKSDGAPETKLGAGSYLLQAAGKKHVSGCATGAECTFFMTSDGKFDLIDDSKAAASDKK
jgi:anti-sigma factor ChrR (cupin superfamily)